MANRAEQLLGEQAAEAEAHESLQSQARRLFEGVRPSNAKGADEIWAAYRAGDKGVFFRRLNIRNDGGLGKEDAAERLFSVGRVFSAGVAIFFVLFNVYYIFFGFASLIINGPDSSGADQFLLLINRDDQDSSHSMWVIQMVIASTESLVMSVMLLYMVLVVARYNCCPGRLKLDHYRIYLELNVVCISTIPNLGNFSALKLLNYLNPQTLMGDLSDALTLQGPKRGYCCVLTRFTFTHLFAGFVGFLAFVVKLSALVIDLLTRFDDTEIPYSTMDFFYQLVVLFGFVNQLFGFAQVSKVQLDRLGLFLFGGEDSQLDAEGMSSLYAYLGSVSHKIMTEFYKDHPHQSLRRATAMLTLSHTDLQYLVLDERSPAERAAAFASMMTMGEGASINLPPGMAGVLAASAAAQPAAAAAAPAAAGAAPAAAAPDAAAP